MSCDKLKNQRWLLISSLRASERDDAVAPAQRVRRDEARPEGMIGRKVAKVVDACRSVPEPSPKARQCRS
jgi:hypothetical protein